MSYHYRLREQVLELLGGKCAWEGCNWIDPRALQIDHIEGGGFKDLKGSSFLLKVLKEKGKGYQLLCANHNWIKKAERKEHSWRLPK